jgi:RNA polymerase sigma-70 factor (ECF subfamily)
MSAGERAGEGPRPSSHTSIRLQRAAEGDRESLAWIVERFTPLLLACAAHRMTPEARRLCDPEDLVDEVWAVALPRLRGWVAFGDRFAPALVKYLSTTLIHLAQRLARKQSLRAGAAEPAPASASGSRAAPVERVPADVTGVVTAAVRRESHGTALAALEGLEPEEREVVVLRAVEQRSNAEAAGLLGVAPGTVAVRYHRALQRLRARLPGSIFEELAGAE